MDWIFNSEIWVALFTLATLEIVLGIDNLVFISIAVSRLPPERRPKARRFGLALACVTRILLLLSLTLLARMVAQVTGLGVGDFVHTFGDLHLYSNHLEQAREQLQRAPLPPPRLELDPSVSDLFDFRFEHIHIRDYQSHAAIRAPVAV